LENDNCKTNDKHIIETILRPSRVSLKGRHVRVRGPGGDASTEADISYCTDFFTKAIRLKLIYFFHAGGG
jgi:hypothetical protein